MLQLAAALIAWRKAKSERIGLRLPLPPGVRTAMGTGEVRAFEREGGTWRGLGHDEPIALAALLDYEAPARGPDAPVQGRAGVGQDGDRLALDRCHICAD